MSNAKRKLRKLRLVEAGSRQTKPVKARIWDSFGERFDPVIELVKLAKATNNDAVAAQCYAQVCKYCYPQLKSIEVKDNVLHDVAMTDLELVNRFRQFMGRKPE